ncbi:MAG: DUF6443 domain-containing protein [Flavisolibacter sp.]
MTTTVPTSSASITVTTTVAISAGSITTTTQTITYNTIPATINSISSASGGDCSPSYSYQWQSSTDNLNFSNISGQTGLNLTFSTPLTTTTFYRRMVTENNSSSVAYTSSDKVVVMPQLQPGTISGYSNPTYYNTSPGTMTCSPSGGNCGGSYTFQWQSSSNNSNWSNITGATASAYNPGNLTSSIYYRVSVSCGSENGFTPSIQIIVSQLIPGTITSPVSTTQTYNTDPGIITGTVPSGGAFPGNYSYQWESSPDNSTFTVINGATSQNYDPGLMTASKFFRRKSICGTEGIYSNTINIVITPQIHAGTLSPTSINGTFATSPGILTCTSATGGNCAGFYTYQWQYSTDNMTFTDISGANTLSFPAPNIYSSIFYRLKITCGIETTFSNICTLTMTDATCAKMNFTKERDILFAGITDTATSNQLSNLSQVQQKTQYFDGLGRLAQTVIRQGSMSTSNGTPTDLVIPNLFDAFDRESYKLLPYPSSSSNNGSYKCNFSTEQNNYYNSKYANEQYNFSKTSFENSQLNRSVIEYAPGINWIGSGRGVQTQYLINDISDSVRSWTIDYAIPTIPVSFGTYQKGQLYKTVQMDEQNRQVIEYKDKNGLVVLKKVQFSNSPGSGHIGWFCTYYVYDDLRNLRFVLQPRAVEYLLSQGNWTITATLRDELCFYYHFDSKGRMSIKKVPGSGPVWMVYDVRDRLVMAQDSSLRVQGKWMVTEYDSLNRPYRTGLLTDANNQSYHQNLAWNSSSYPSTATNYEVLAQTGYDDYTQLPTGAPSSTIDLTNYTPTNFYTTYNTSPQNAQQVLQNSQTRGMITWSKIKVIGSSSTYLFVTSIYDDRGRSVQVKSTNYSSGVDVVTTQFNFIGKVLKTHILHQKNGTNSHNYQLLTTYKYDVEGRIDSIGKRTSVDVALGSTDKIIVQNSYNEIGQLVTKTIGANLESMVYEYNIRGWLLGANRSFAKDTTSTTNYFGFDLGYDKTALTINGTTQSYANALYNGNIEGMLWKSKGDQQTRKYDFTYDNVNRLTSANFLQFNSNSFNLSAGTDFSVTGLTYDANGNIMSMNQRGWRLSSSSFGNTIDSLKYTYLNNGYSNKLQNVIDLANDTLTKLGDFRSSSNYMKALGTKTVSAVDYAYDGNGNLSQDLNKDLQAGSITYNYLNLPQTIKVKGKGIITYTYDAGGNKLSKVTTDSTVSPIKTTTTLYMLGNFVNDTLQFLPQEEGRIRWRTDSSKLVYDYFLKDHLGNVRMMLTEDAKTDLYPAATMESVNDAVDTLLYSNIPATRSLVSGISGYPLDNSYSNPNQYVAKVNGSGNKIGPAIALKVMAGDQFNVRVSYWYSSGTTSYPSPNPLNELVNALATSLGGILGSHATSTQLSSSTSFSNNAGYFLNSEAYTSSNPKAYLNWVLFDEQFKYVASSSGYIQVGPANGTTVSPLMQNGIPINKNGYLYVYVSNQTPGQDVFFDNLQVTHIRGPILEQTDYYPFGLTMQGISSKALNFGTPNNKYKYNGKEQQSGEFSDGSGLEEYDFKFRFHDMQIGRFFNQDRLSDKFVYMSPYQFCSNNPIWLKEIDGLEGVKFIEMFNGNSKQILEKNVVILIERKKEIANGASQKQIAKIERQNARIEARNADRVANIRAELNTFYNGSDGKGTTDSKGNTTEFRFNVTAVPDIDKTGLNEKQIEAAYKKISDDNGIKAVSQFDHSIDELAPAAVLTNDDARGGDQGNTTSGRIMRVNFGAPAGTTAHEVSHTLGLVDNGYLSGGILASPPEQISSSEVDEILKKAYDKK